LTQIAREAGTIRNGKLRRDFLTAFAESPVDFLRGWLDSQAHDLDLVLGGDRAGLATSAGDDVWKSDQRRKAPFYANEWIKDSINVHQERQQNSRGK
jgi:SWI/SNF-related matrix-associated actin-dependent regulator of chromatin subfamily D